jgi:G3E family GTPase
VTSPGRIPVLVVGGFLGSGKTSLLRHRLTGSPDTAVIVNEFGAVGLDHQLLRA